jgi:hypothetical protein
VTYEEDSREGRADRRKSRRRGTNEEEPEEEEALLSSDSITRAGIIF